MIPRKAQRGHPDATVARMLHTCIAVVVALAACVFANAQDKSGNAISSDMQLRALKRVFSEIPIVDPGSFAPRPPVINIDVQQMLPAAAIGQIRFYGGQLQTYLNLAGADVAHDLHLPFGGTAVIPVTRWRMELFGGIGGAFATFHTPYAMTNSWMTQTSVGARVSLDPGRRVWVGTSANYIADFADKKRQWVTGSADLTLRFGK